ncbi:type II secretion system protein [Sulfurimonas sp. SAG-AH-194-L11]|nr:type II secretion system protein [Sulfurimonas sp. SAG-AH-194-L11]MDF1876592.1 type II secretion system protein [Sulfurimonas sp. SAG-AH-194-L11]
MYIKKNAFTMIELVFVIVVLGILSAIAIPKFAATRTDAQITKAIADISSIRSAIVTERQSRLITGQSNYINSLSSSSTTLFDGNGTATSKLLMYGIKAGTTDGHWSTDSASAPYVSYIYKIGGSSCNFTYTPADGIFKLDPNQDAICDNLVN